MPYPRHLTLDILLEVRFYRGKPHAYCVRFEITFPAVFLLSLLAEARLRLLFRPRRYFLRPLKSSNRIPEPRRHLDADAFHDIRDRHLE